MTKLLIAFVAFSASALLAQKPDEVIIEDSGDVTTLDQFKHLKTKGKVHWVRNAGPNEAWFVRFANNVSPCQDGQHEFSSTGVTECVITYICPHLEECHFPYVSSLTLNSPGNDPEIIVDGGGPPPVPPAQRRPRQSTPVGKPAAKPVPNAVPKQ